MIAFWILAVILIATAVWTVSARKPVYSVIALLAHFLALAFMFVTLSAEFMAMIQMIVYTGAILILFVFVITLLSSGVAPFALGPNRMPRAAIPAALVVALAFGFVAYALGSIHLSPAVTARSGFPFGPAGTAKVFGSVADFGTSLFTTHLLPFEITAFILMVAVIGVILLAGDQPPYVGTQRQAEMVRREMREAILREGGE
jgi:NADH-quinone oxidoreductase subunit J